MWSAYESLLTAFRDVYGMQLPEHKNLAIWEEASLSGGFRVLHEKFCLVCNRPEFIKIDDNNRPHCEDGPSHRWRDGWSLYFWHGVKVPGWIIERPDTIDTAKIAAEENAEIKRIMIDRMGVSRYLQETGAKVVHMDMVEVVPGSGDFMPRALMKDKDGRQFLVGTDGSTERTYYMQSSREAKTCGEAHMAINGGLDDALCVAQS